MIIWPPGKFHCWTSICRLPGASTPNWLALLLDDLGVDDGRRAQHVRIALSLRPQQELLALRRMGFAEQVGAKTIGTPAQRDADRLQPRSSTRPACANSGKPSVRPRRRARRRSTSVGTRYVPRALIRRAVASSMRLPCSMVRRRPRPHGSRARRVGVRQHVGRRGLGLLDGGAISSSVNCRRSSGSDGLATPPAAMILIWWAPRGAPRARPCGPRRGCRPRG